MKLLYNFIYIAYFLFLRLKLSAKDKSAVFNFKKFIRSTNKVYRAKTVDREIEGRTLKNSTSYSILVSDLSTTEQLCDKFGVITPKTYNPPINYETYRNFSINFLLSWLIGFIDGDGTIKRRKDRPNSLSVSIRCHKSWKTFFSEFNSILEEKLDRKVGVTGFINNTELCYYNIHRKNFIRDLKCFIQEHNLPVLERKWDKVVID